MKTYDPRHGSNGCLGVLGRVAGILAIAGILAVAIAAQHAGAHAAVIQSWASVRHQMCKIERTYFLHHAHGTFNCFWSRVNAHKWIQTGIANLTRP